MDDLISREEAIDLAYDCEDEFGKDVVFRFVDYLRGLPSAQPNVSFWKKRASEYESICANLVSQLLHGTKYKRRIINENGIEFSPQPDWNEMLVICDNCGHAIHVKREDKK